MAIKHICDKCGGERDVRKVKMAALSESIDKYDRLMLEKDLCITCRAKLSVIVNKFMANDDIVFVR